MSLMFDGSFKAIEERTIARLAEEGFSISAGSVTRLLTSIINSEISSFYTVLNETHLQAFVSTASGSFLGAIGQLLDCYREEEEEDAKYRERITKQILKTASSNETAIRLAALSVDGVNDVYLKNFSHGAGTFTLIVLADNYDASDTLIVDVHNAVKETVAYGVSFIVDKPFNNNIQLNLKLVFKEDVDDIVGRDIKLMVKEKTKEYINSLKIGDTFITNELTQRVMEVSDKIVTYVCTDFRINKKPAMYVNQVSNWSSRFIISPEPNAITIE